MKADMFVSLLFQIFTEFFMSGDAKFLLVHGAFERLRESGRYNEEEMERLRTAINESAQYKTYNDFMG
jgi:hypothetical protein